MSTSWFRFSKRLQIYLDLNKYLKRVKRKMFSDFTIPFKMREQFTTEKYFKLKNIRTILSVSNAAINQLILTCSKSTTEILEKGINYVQG